MAAFISQPRDRVTRSGALRERRKVRSSHDMFLVPLEMSMVLQNSASFRMRAHQCRQTPIKGTQGRLGAARVYLC